MSQPHVVVVGGGILGLATAYKLLRRHPGWRLTVLEKEAELAAHQTGRNSGVIHRGIYYAPGSLKAQLCAAGAEELVAFCDENGVSYQLCGKLIVAVEEAELPCLAELERRARANKVPGLEVVGPERIAEIEPAAHGLRGLYSPATGIADYRAVVRALAGRLEDAGADVRTGLRALDIQRDGRKHRVLTTQGDIEADGVVCCAGLQSDRIGRVGGEKDFGRIVPFRGDYWLLEPSIGETIRGMIYPVPDPRFPFLGVHVTRRMDGMVLAGPNAVLALARERYGRLDINLRDAWSSLGYAGFWKLAARYWRTGLAEVWRDMSRAAYARAIARYVPAVRPRDLLPGPAGIRAQLLSPVGHLVDDFVIESTHGIVSVLNAPSPAATSSFAIADRIANMLEESLSLD